MPKDNAPLAKPTAAPTADLPQPPDATRDPLIIYVSELERMTDDRHYISGWDGIPGEGIDGRLRIAYLRSTPTEPPDLFWIDGWRNAHLQ